MNPCVRQVVSSFVLTGVLLTSALAVSGSSSVADDDASLRELAIAMREQAERARQARIQGVLARQKIDILKVYLNSRGAWINGRQLGNDDISAVATAAELKEAVITHEVDVTSDRVTEVRTLLDRAGMEQIRTTVRNHDARAEREADLREIILRQKNAVLRVYLKNARDTYVNGKSVSTEMLARLIRIIDPEKVVVAANPAVLQARIVALEKVLRAAGVENIERLPQTAE